MRFTTSRKIHSVSASLAFLDEKIRAELSGQFVIEPWTEDDERTRLPAQPRVNFKPEDNKGPTKK